MGGPYDDNGRWVFMNFWSNTTRRISRLGQVIERPHLLRLRVRGVPLALSIPLDKPWLRALDIRTVLDIGANAGQFALVANELFPRATIHSFEPLPDCFAELTRHARRVGQIVPHQVALGERSGTVTFNRNDFTPSSSILAVSPRHIEAFPYTGRTRTLEVPIERLDTIAPSLSIEDGLLVKIDVQGYEDRVFAGGEATIRRAQLLIVETSFTELYRDQPTHEAVCLILAGWGFQYAGALDQLECPTTGRVLSADSLFVPGAR